MELVIRSLTLVGRSEQRASSPLSPDACLTEDGERERERVLSLLVPPLDSTDQLISVFSPPTSLIFTLSVTVWSLHLLTPMTSTAQGTAVED